jgi:hypothetical protein
MRLPALNFSDACRLSFAELYQFHSIHLLLQLLSRAIFLLDNSSSFPPLFFLAEQQGLVVVNSPIPRSRPRMRRSWRIGEGSSVWVNLVAAPANLAIAALEFAVWSSLWCFLAVSAFNF